ncbi:hypothetical protein O181_059900 [Austropuccinia psidii MF-1]|uniref:Uncharacterized protein n=1 Tax=Austropuccinia psidii MF-1 TaxID=1389203 RepID=A0A9Q3ECC9_9BASI|nr:hypothetical protein [Austropuccinia psidii MF-1]
MDHLMKHLLTIFPTAKDFHDIWKRACETAAKSYLKLNNTKNRGTTRHMWNQTSKKGTRYRENAVDVRLTEEFSRKHPVFPVSLFKPYLQIGEDKFPFRKKTSTAPDKVGIEDSPFPVEKIIKARKIRLNGKDQKQYLVIFKNKRADKDKW